MKTIQVTELKPGMRFDKAVYLDGENIFIPANIAIKEKDITRLEKWEIREVYSEGSLLQGDSTESQDQGTKKTFVQLAFQSEAQQEVIFQYEKVSKAFNEVLTKVEVRDSLDEFDIKVIIDDIFKILTNFRTDVTQYILYGMQGESGPVENAINSTILSIMMGQQLHLPPSKVQSLATSALLHDLGMIRVGKKVFEKQESLSEEELQQIKTHPIHSYKIITKELGFSDDIGLPALQHQERWDGKGYPKGLKGKDIVLQARIISVADAFEAMVSNRPYRSSMIGYNAMRTILSDNERRFDPEILKIFIKTMGIYPIGSIVLLSNASIGRVTENRPNAPLRPKIKIMVSPAGKAFTQDEGEIIDLLEERNVYVARAVDPREVADKTGINE